MHAHKMFKRRSVQYFRTRRERVVMTDPDRMKDTEKPNPEKYMKEMGNPWGNTAKVRTHLSKKMPLPCHQQIIWIEVRVQSNKSSYCDEKPRNDQSERIPKKWRQLTSLKPTHQTTRFWGEPLTTHQKRHKKEAPLLQMFLRSMDLTIHSGSRTDHPKPFPM